MPRGSENIIDDHMDERQSKRQQEFMALMNKEAAHLAKHKSLRRESAVKTLQELGRRF